jgi:PPOX class probable F420-dependent enzyme
MPPEAHRLIDQPNFAHLATLMANGSPKVEPVWVGREGDTLLVATDAKSLKARNAAGDDRVAVSIVAEHNPYEQLLIRGRVTEVRPDDDLAVLDALSMKYLGTPFARRRWSQRVVLVITPHLARHYISPLQRPEQPPSTTPTPSSSTSSSSATSSSSSSDRGATS